MRRTPATSTNCGHRTYATSVENYRRYQATVWTDVGNEKRARVKSITEPPRDPRARDSRRHADFSLPIVALSQHDRNRIAKVALASRPGYHCQNQGAPMRRTLQIVLATVAIVSGIVLYNLLRDAQWAHSWLKSTVVFLPELGTVGVPGLKCASG
jgi:hypothetical protein